MYVIVKFWRAQPLSNLYCTNIAGLREDVGNGEHAKALVVVNFVAGDINGPIFAIENFVGSGNALIERRCKGDELES